MRKPISFLWLILVTFTFYLENENRQKTHSKVTKNEIKGFSPIFGESLNYKSGFVFFVPALEVPSFEVSSRALLAKKWNFQCQYKKSDTTCKVQTFPKNEVFGLWFHFFVTFDSVFLTIFIFEHFWPWFKKVKVTKMKSAILQSKESSDRKIVENRPILKFNFTLKNMSDIRFWAIWVIL